MPNNQQDRVFKRLQVQFWIFLWETTESNLSPIWKLYREARWFYCLLLYCLYFSAQIFCLHVLLGWKYWVLGTLQVWSIWPTNWCSVDIIRIKKNESKYSLCVQLVRDCCIQVDACITSYFYINSTAKTEQCATSLQGRYKWLATLAAIVIT